VARGKLAVIWDLAAAINVGSWRASWLFLSERAVKTHITNILNKLGLNSRTQTGRWMADLNGPGPTAAEERP